ncbi:8375_t:CDS:2, partial [Funneliformis mosseae]
LTFARIFTNAESSEAYKRIFYEVFSIVEKDNGIKIEFSYLNSNSNRIACIIANVHKGQAIEMFAEEYLKHIFKICIIHYNRAIPTCKTKNQVKKAFKLTENCKSKAAEELILSLLAAIKKAKEFDYREWDATLNFVKYNVSASGVNKSQSEQQLPLLEYQLPPLVYHILQPSR